MVKTILIYSLGIAGIAFLLQGLEYLYLVRFFTVEMYTVLIAIFFTAFGIWVGYRLTYKRRVGAGFQRNQKALDYLGISVREYEVLELLAEGLSNKEIADKLFVSQNTIKTHLARLYDKLEASRRTQAVQKARDLRLIP